MQNLDAFEKDRNDILTKIGKSATDGDPEKFEQAFKELAEYTEKRVLNEAHELFKKSDANILAQRGKRPLTSEEFTYWQKAIVQARDDISSGRPKNAVVLIDETLPLTTIDSIFEDISTNHPLLDAVNFQNTTVLTRFLTAKSSGVAGWGELGSKISDELAGEFQSVDLSQKKLTAFIPVSKDMLDLGPTWLDQFVRTVLSEALAAELEATIVNGDGNGKPVGMSRKLTGVVDGVYPQKDARAITAFDTVTYGALLSDLSKTDNGNRRAITSVLLVVNPEDYFTKIFPSVTPRTIDGTFNYNVFPFPTTVVQSAGIPVGQAVIGLGDRYFMGLGTGKGGKIEYSDEYKFLENLRVYTIKLYGNGRALDENAFILLDISGLVPYVPKVEVVNSAEVSGS
ncbi:MAG TPA: phage major capsid protein [Ruminococcaceae bacterium]|nr:phage major capsid protein [Oscillospiraceae bacterium]